LCEIDRTQSTLRLLDFTLIFGIDRAATGLDQRDGISGRRA